MKTIYSKVITLFMALVFGLMTVSGDFSAAASSSSDNNLSKYEKQTVEEYGEIAKKEDNKITQKDINKVKEDANDSSKAQLQGKASLSIKAAQKLISKNAKKIDGAIDKAIYKIPGVKTETKKKWTKRISAAGMAKYLGTVTGVFDSAEEAVEHYLTDKVGAPGWIAKPVVKTVFFFIT